MLSSLTRLVLVNAAYFKDSWADKFSEAEDAEFFTNTNDKVTTKFIQNTNAYQYSESDNLQAQVVKIPFQNYNYSMIFVLPYENVSLQAVEAKLASLSFLAVISGLEFTRVQVKLPKYRIENTIDLKTILQELGIVRLFTDAADLSGIVCNESVSVSDVVQKTYINVDENGVEAAAATGVVVGITSVIFDPEPPKEFTANRPFWFALAQNNLIIFEGKLSKIENVN